MRKKIEIILAEDEFSDKVWYDRHQLLNHKKTDKEILKAALKNAKEIEKKYKKKNLGPYTDFEWGMINGKLSTLRWVLGEDWDVLDS